MNRHVKMGWVAAGLACLAGGSVAAPERPPNLVFILMDDLGIRDLGCYGSTFHRTPHIDRLCAEGLKFTQAYAAGPICSPTRASILTGQYPARLRLTDFIPGRVFADTEVTCPVPAKSIPLKTPSIVSELKRAGYASAIFGKWHVANSPKLNPAAYGFDESFDDGPGLNKESPPEDPKGVFTLTGKAIDFIGRHKDRPFFLFLSHYSVHNPVACNPALRDEYAARADPAAGQKHPGYAAMLDDTDRSVGQLLAAIKELGLEENTVVLFFSDNGGLEGNTSCAPFRGGKGSLYEGGVRVPLIVRWPGRIPPGGVTDEIVSSVDFLPTFLELAGAAPLPSVLDGKSFAPVWAGTGGMEREAIFWHFPHYYQREYLPCSAVRAGRYKLIHLYGAGRDELYDLEADASELHDLAATMPEKVAELSVLLAKWKASVNAQEVAANPAYVPDVVASGAGSVATESAASFRSAGVQAIVLGAWLKHGTYVANAEIALTGTMALGGSRAGANDRVGLMVGKGAGNLSGGNLNKDGYAIGASTTVAYPGPMERYSVVRPAPADSDHAEAAASAPGHSIRYALNLTLAPTFNNGKDGPHSHRYALGFDYDQDGRYEVVAEGAFEVAEHDRIRIGFLAQKGATATAAANTNTFTYRVLPRHVALPGNTGMPTDRSARAEDRKVFDVVLVAGQSNAVGFDADAATLAPDPADTEVRFWWRCGDPPPDEYDSTGGGAWTPLQPQPRGTPDPDKTKPRQYGNFRFERGGFGPEIGFARRLTSKQTNPLAIIKVAFSGTGIGTDWDPAAAGKDGACYRALLDEVRQALAAAEAEGLAVRLRALIWVQGENDAKPEKAAVYEEKLYELVGSLRRDLSAPNLAVLMGVNTTFGGGTNMVQVVDAQKAVASRMPRCVYVDTEGASLANQAHFDTDGTLEIGRRFAEALIQNRF